jgi:Ca2+-binding RTX toxin-like protein
MPSTISVRKFTSFTVTQIAGNGDTLVSIIYGTGFTYDAQGNPTGGTVYGMKVDHFTVQTNQLWLTETISKLINVTVADLELFTPPVNGEWYEPSNYGLILTYDTTLVTTSSTVGGGTIFQGGILDEKFVGGANADIFIGNDGDDRMTGNGGADMFNGGNGNDVMIGDLSAGSGFFGGQGIDVMFGGGSNDTMNGGSENDALSSGGGDDVSFGGTGNDALVGGGGNDVLYGGGNDDRMQGGAGNDDINGDNGNDRLAGGADNDIVDGSAGDDKVYGNDGNDSVIGGAGFDILTGNAGDDFIKFADDRDLVIGGTGADTFVFAQGGTVAASSIQDFNALEDFLVLGDDNFNLGIAHTAQENFTYFLTHAVETTKGVTFTGDDGKQAFFRLLHLSDLTVANFLATNGSDSQFL